MYCFLRFYLSGRLVASESAVFGAARPVAGRAGLLSSSFMDSTT